MSVEAEVRRLVAPILADLGLDLYDLEHRGGKLLVTVEHSGGVDLDQITLATRLISRELDHADPIPGRYQLEVSSPGVERRLRTAAHFRAAVGKPVAVRTAPDVEGERRVDGLLTAADDEGIVVRTADGRERRLAFDDIERARTVFAWGPAPRPGGPTRRAARTPNTRTEADAR